MWQLRVCTRCEAPGGSSTCGRARTYLYIKHACKYARSNVHIQRSVSAPLGWSLTRSDLDLPIDDLIEEYMKDGGGGVGKGSNGMDDNGDAIDGGIHLTRLSPVRALPDGRGSRAIRCNEAGAGKRSPIQQHSATDLVAFGYTPHARAHLRNGMTPTRIQACTHAHVHNHNSRHTKPEVRLHMLPFEPMTVTNPIISVTLCVISLLYVLLSQRDSRARSQYGQGGRHTQCSAGESTQGAFEPFTKPERYAHAHHAHAHVHALTHVGLLTIYQLAHH